MNTQVQPSSHRKILKLNRIQTCPPRIVLTPQLLAEHSPHKPLTNHVQGCKDKCAPGRDLGQLFTPKKRLYSDMQSSPQKPRFTNSNINQDSTSMQESPHMYRRSMQDRPQEPQIPEQYNMNSPGTRLTQRIKNDSCSYSHPENVNPKKRFKMDDSEFKSVRCYKNVCSKFVFNSVCILMLISISIGLWNNGQIEEVQLKGTMCSNSSQFSIADLGKILKSQVFGQHIAVNQMLLTLEAYLARDASEPLMLMFNGWTGTGKSYMAQLVTSLAPATSHIYILPLHFSNNRRSHESNHSVVSDTKSAVNSSHIQESKLAFTVQAEITECALNIFILDDFSVGMDHIVKDLQNIYSSLTDSRNPNTKVVIIVITSIGSPQINRITLHHLTSGESLDSLSLSVLDKEIKTQMELAYPSIGKVFQFQYIPFLPLESSHIEKCIERYIKSVSHRRLTDKQVHDNIQKVLKLVSFFPSKNPIFSVSGCKKIDTLVDITLD